MQASILTIGDELLDGYIVDSNSTWIENELWGLGIRVRMKMTVRDRMEEIVAALEFISGRSDIVILSGGLGPTADDLTREALSEYLKIPLVFQEKVYSLLKKRFAHYKIPIPDENKKQAYIIDGALMINNPRGTAPGMIVGTAPLYALFPGVPSELTAMFPQLLEHLKTAFPQLQPIPSVIMKTFGLSESSLDERLDALRSEKVRIGTIFKQTGVEVRFDFLDKEISQETAMQWVKTSIESFPDIQRSVFGYGKSAELMTELFLLMKFRKARVITAESCTGGMLAQHLTSVPGSSEVFLGGVNAYHNEVKIGVLGVKPATLDDFGAVSFQTASEMLDGLKKISDAMNPQGNLFISITGVAGPDGGSAEKPVGTVFIGIMNGQTGYIGHFRFVGNRDQVRSRSVMKALEMIWEILNTGKIDPEAQVNVLEWKTKE